MTVKKLGSYTEAEIINMSEKEAEEIIYISSLDAYKNLLVSMGVSESSFPAGISSSKGGSGMQIVHDNIFNAPLHHIICHQVNTFGKMGRGIALEIKERYPSIYRHYAMICANSTPSELLGTCHIFSHTDENHNCRRVANLFGQVEWQTDYRMLRKALESLKDTFLKSPCFAAGYKLAIPYKMSCGLAKGNWNIVEPMINEILGDLAVIYNNE